MKNSFLKLISRFSRDQKGVVAIIFALALIPLLGASGAAIDYSRAYIVQSRLANALDATALAMGASAISNDQQLKDYGQKFFDANYPADKIGVPSAIKVDISKGFITVTGKAQLPTSLMGLIGVNHLDVNAVSQVAKEQTALEVAMVLDNTGSMGGQKLRTLKEASNMLIDKMFAGESKHDVLKMGLVPFASSVNVGSQYEKSGWIDRRAKSPLHGINFTKKNGKGRNIFTIYNGMKNTKWEGCVETRSYPMDVRDTPPRSNAPATLWVPYFYPDEPDYGNYYHNYLKDKKWGSAQARQRDIAKYKGKAPGRNRNGSYAGPGYNCEISPITPLTDTKKTIKDGISRMVANGSTSIPIGLAWGWRVLSPGKPFTQGAKYKDRQNPATKIIILMSDGDNVVGDLPNHNKSWYTGYGFVSEQINTSRLSSTVAWQARNEVDERQKELCKNIKKKGIIIFSVAFAISNVNTKNLMKKCASGDDRFFDANDNAKLLAAFASIAKELGELRLSK